MKDSDSRVNHANPSKLPVSNFEVYSSSLWYGAFRLTPYCTGLLVLDGSPCMNRGFEMSRRHHQASPGPAAIFKKKRTQESPDKIRPLAAMTSPRRELKPTNALSNPYCINSIVSCMSNGTSSVGTSQSSGRGAGVATGVLCA